MEGLVVVYISFVTLTWTNVSIRIASLNTHTRTRKQLRLRLLISKLQDQCVSGEREIERETYLACETVCERDWPAVKADYS